jgi:hypothetical protein
MVLKTWAGRTSLFKPVFKIVLALKYNQYNQRRQQDTTPVYFLKLNREELKVRFLNVLGFFMLLPSLAMALPVGDTQGKVSAVRVLNNTSGSNSLRVYFSTTTNDRFECVKNDGYITIRENGSNVTAVSYEHIYSMALTALASGSVLALDSAASSPCVNVNTSMVVAN